MTSRILSTLLIWTVIAASLIFFGEHGAVALVTFLGLLALHEFYVLTGKMGIRPFHWMGLLLGLFILAGPYCLIALREDRHGFSAIAAALVTLLVVIGSLIICCFRVLGERDNSNRIETIAATVMGLLYIPFTLQFLALLLLVDFEKDCNLTLCIWTVAVSKFCDVGALLSGLALGKHKMSPNISPKKTWEGAIGGVLTSAGVGAAFAYFAADYLPDGMNPITAAIIAVPLAITTIVSDLIESVLKRRADIKDSGSFIPGIGGALDLTDSLLLTAPVAFFIFLFLFAFAM